jgi:uncharacterized protein
VTVPLLIFLGVPPVAANGTNRVALIFQNISGTLGFYRGGVRQLRTALWLALPALVGSLCGAWLAVEIDPLLFKRVLGGILPLAALLVVSKPSFARGEASPCQGRPRGLLFLLFFLVGLYGGFIQIGVGVFILLLLIPLGGYDLNNANAIKVSVILVYTLLALAIFAWHGQVIWLVGLVLALGNSLGAWLATLLARRTHTAWVRWLLLAAVLASSGRLLGLY